MDVLSHTVCSIDWDKVVRVLSALLTPTIVLLTCFIAWHQHKTNKNQFRLALLERRLKILNGTREFIAKVIGQANIQTADLTTFLQETRESEFLFGADIAQHLKDLYDKGVELHTLRATPNPANATAQAQITSWFRGQDAEAIKKFGKYMSFKKAD
jgi:hypothetical protein